MSTLLCNKTISKTTPLWKENLFPQFNVASHKRQGIRLSFEYTTTLLSGEGGEGRTGTATMFRKMLSKYTIFSTVLSKIVVVNHLSVQTFCTISGSFGTFIIFALQSVSWRDKLYFNSITFKNSPILFKYWRTCILIKNMLFEKRSSCGRASMSKVKTSHFFALESISYVNKYSKTEILAFCYWHN